MTSWLNEWLLEADLRTPAEALQRLEDPAALDGLVALANQYVEKDRFSPLPDPSRAVVASRKLDLSAQLSCGAVECQIKIVNGLLAHTWHYFDTVVVEGYSAHQFVEQIEGDPDPTQLVQSLAPHVALLFYLREAGALDYLEFRDKPHRFCANHFEDHARDLGFQAALEPQLAAEMIERILDGATIKDHELNGERFYLFESPMLDLSQVFQRPDGSEPDLEQIAGDIFNNHAVFAVGDVALATELGTPLALAQSELADPSVYDPETSEADVALELPLPILEGVPIQDLLKLREDLKPEFDQFRAALVLAIRERVQAAGSKDPAKIAQAVSRDFIEPAIAELDTKMRAAGRLLRRKATLDVVAGSVATVAVGLVAAAPIIVGAALTAGARLLAPAHEYQESKRDIEIADLYFLWKAKQEFSPH